jgi:hypothetical protein
MLEIIIYVFASIALVVAAVFMVSRLRPGSNDSITSFDFGKFKTREINKRGVHDKTRWH